MSPRARQVPIEVDPEQFHRGIQAISGLGANIINILIIIWHWGQWSVVLGVLGIAAVLSAVNVLLIDGIAKRFNRPLAETIRMLANVGGFIIGAHLLQWSVLAWLFVPYHMLWFHGLDDWGRPRMVLYLVVVNTAAWWDGSDVQMAVSFTALSIFSYLISERRGSLLFEALQQVIAQREQLARAHRELQQAHQRALEQEKLSSLGMMAAGVAHEINNPMSFVTSNVNCLLKDLRQQPQLPEPLREYVDDVLPATLDGIKRVNAIVADLRRFARGDPEAHVDYDLNSEVQAALRIAHGQLSHCRVETDLQAVGTVMGRPQQIVQVLVNLLVNAGQATAPGGVVSVATRRELDGVRVDIRDTGAGMSEETLKRLFQPFFTTKPVGMGTGLGLAVAHGIISSHGGRIEVQSSPQRGSCFSLHLPRVPPPLHHGPGVDEPGPGLTTASAQAKE